ncbi:hypothetical protein TNCV_2826871 [Trichonephila clavipes]|nr:hypothetical protein TNCV_2826871 [Trichonephila clavipes]
MGCELVINHCRPCTFPGSWYHFSVVRPIGEYQSPQVILTPSFLPRGRHLSSGGVNLYQALIIPRTSKPNRHSRDLLHAVYSYNMVAVDFIHQKNPPTWAGVEPTTLGPEDQRHSNHATQPASIVM